MAERISLTRRRQTSKPLLERQRRARINRSLEELKGLVLSALYRDNDQNFQKMEKAEILELTVNFLKMIREQQVTGYWTNQSDSESLSNYRAGFNECATKVCSFMENQKSGVDSKLREQMMAGLAASCSYNMHATSPGHVKSDSPVSYSPSPAVYGLQNTGESHFLCASTPPPSPPSSAFRPFIPYEDAMLIKAGNTTSSHHAAVEFHTKSAARHGSPVEYSSPPLWRPWMSNTQDGQI